MAAAIHVEDVLEEAERNFGNAAIEFGNTAIEYAYDVHHGCSERAVTTTAEQGQFIAEFHSQVSGKRCADDDLGGVVVAQEASFRDQPGQCRHTGFVRWLDAENRYAVTAVLAGYQCEAGRASRNIVSGNSARMDSVSGTMSATVWRIFLSSM